MARQRSRKSSARANGVESPRPAKKVDDEPEAADLSIKADADLVDDDLAGADLVDDDGSDADDEVERSTEAEEFWSRARIEPVEIALPGGVGYTLRAYRMSNEVTLPDFDHHEDGGAPLDLDDDAVEIDEEELTAQALAAGRTSRRDVTLDKKRADRDEDEDEEDDEFDDEIDSDAEEYHDDLDEEDEEEAEEEDDEVEEPEAEEIPVFLAEDRRLLLFRSPEGLAEYVRTAAGHDLAQLDTWDAVREGIRTEYVAPLDDNRYGLDLVVKNLRGGHDAWDPALIIQAGEVARDLGYALRIEAVVSTLATGSPLDDLDEGLRAVENGGFGAFFARRRIRKIDAQTTAALGWRTIIGKISAAVDWRN